MIVDGIEVVMNLRKALRGLQHDKQVAIDIETTGLSPFRNHIATVQLYGDTSGTLALLQYPNGVLPFELVKFLSDPDHTLIAHNGVGFDAIFLQQAGVNVTDPSWYDTLVAETVLDVSNRRDRSVSLRASVKRRLGTKLDKDIDHGGWAKKLSQRKVEYAVRDVIHLPALMRSQQERAAKTSDGRALALEMDIVPVVIGMVVNGIPISVEKLRSYIGNLSVRIEAVLPKLQRALPTVDNFNSPIQIRRAMNELGIDIKSTKKEVMQELVRFGGPANEIAQLVLDYRAPRHRQKMYDEEWIRLYVIDHGVDAVENRVHPHFWQCGTDTTRFTSTNPNLQQVPKDVDMRAVYGNLPGYKIVAADYSQIEIAIAAAIFGDDVLMSALHTGDVHANIAALLFDIPVEQVTEELRRLAKAATFTLLFGGGPRRLYSYARTRGSNLTPQQAKEFVTTFFRKFGGLRQARTRAAYVAKSQNVVTITLPSGHRRVLAGWKRTMTRILNTPVQGTAAAGIKYALRLCRHRGLADYLSLQVHDELVATVPDREVKDYYPALEEAMIDGMHEACDTVVRVNTKVGVTW